MPSFGGITRPSAITPPFDNNNDVILFGSGYDNYTSPGNEFFRTLCSEERSSVPKKRLRPSEKVDMINKIMTAVKSKGGRFVEENGSEWIEVTDEIARKLISRRLKPSKLSPPQPNSVVIMTSKPKQHSPCWVVAAAALPSDTMETKPTTKDVNTADTTKGVKNADEGPAMNTRSKSKNIPGGHRVQPINGLASFVFKGLLSDSSHQESSSSPVAAAAAVVSSSKFKQWKKNNPEKYKQHIQKSNASLREKRKSNPERYKEENKRRAQQRSNKKNEERIRAAEAKRAAAPATTNHVTATATLALDLYRRYNSQWQEAELKFKNECMSQRYPYPNPKINDTPIMDRYRRQRARRKMSEAKNNNFLGITTKAAAYTPRHRTPQSPPADALATSCPDTAAPRHIIPLPTADKPIATRPVPPTEVMTTATDTHNMSEEERAKQLMEKNTTDAFRQSPPLDDMTEGSGDSDEAVNENEYEAVTGEDDPTTTGPGVLSTVKALLTAYDEETLYGTDYDEETVYGTDYDEETVYDDR